MQTPNEIDAQNGNAKPWITGEDRGEPERSTEATDCPICGKTGVHNCGDGSQVTYPSEQALQEPLYRRDFERAVSKEIETYGAPSGCDEAIAFSDGAEWALAHFSNIIISERDPQ